MNRLALTLMLAAAGLVAGCAPTTTPAGDFCSVVSGPFYYENVEVADFVALNDPRLADKIDAVNTYGTRRCPDWPS